MNKKTIITIVLTLILIFLIGCSPKTTNIQITTEHENATMEKPKEEPLPNFPDNPFEELEPKEHDNPELDDPNVKMIAVRMFQFGFDPETIEVEKGNRVILIITSSDVGHGFALPDFGINERIPPEESVKVDFIADVEGEFEFFESVYSGKGWEDMKGKFIVKPIQN